MQQFFALGFTALLLLGAHVAQAFRPAVPSQSRRVSVIPGDQSSAEIPAEIKGQLTKNGAFHISASGFTWEVDVSANTTIRAAADRLAGTRTLVRGTLLDRKNDARSERVLVARTLEPASDEGRREYVNITVRGTVRTAVMAIGAETTGATITSGAGTWELELDPKQLEIANALNGKSALVTGELRSRSGVEVRTRTILTVRTIQ